MGFFDYILGTAGSGKSTYIYTTLTKRAIEEPQRKFFLFVPEQNTLKAQQEIVRHSEVHGMLNLEVFSFSLMSFRIMEELGIKEPDILDDVSRSMLMRRSVSDVKEALRVYKRKAESPGFIMQLKSAMSEFAQYRITPGRLKDAAKTASTPLLGGKLEDLSLIFESFRKNLSGDGNHAIPEEIPELLLKYIERSAMPKEAVIYFDGFTGFTPVQLEIIEKLSKAASELHFALTLTEAEAGKRDGHFTDLFWLSRETYRKISEMCIKGGMERRGNIVPLSDGQTESAGLIRKGIDVSPVSLDDPAEEIRYIASDIKNRALSGELRYRKAALAVSDLPVYREIIKREFTNLDIPFFIDDKQSAGGSPLVEFLRAALLTVRDNYEYEDVMTFLRNPFEHGREERESADLFENYIRALGLKGRKAYSSDFTSSKYVPEGMGAYMEEIEEFRRKHMTRLFVLHDSLKLAKTAGGKTRAFTDFIESSDLERREPCDDDRRFLSLTMELMERMESLFGGEAQSIKEFADMVEAGFLDMKAGMIPGTMDMVSVGDLKRSRFDDIDALYVVGANEGLIPQANTGGGVFTDRERAELTEGALELAPDDRHDASIQSFCLYLLMNKPAARLVVSCSRDDRDGRPLKPSSIYDKLGSPAPITAAHIVDEELVIKARQRHAPERLDKGIARLLYGDRLTGTVTRLEQYAKCPMRHYLSYGLVLKDRLTFDIEAVDVGRLYHEALDRVIKSIRESRRELKDIESGELMLLASDTVQKAAADYNGSVMYSSARNRYIASQVERITKKTLMKLLYQARCGDFSTVGTEHRFFSEGEEFSLSGSIDRIDSFTEDGKTYVNVIDYKSGSHTFDIGKAYAGLELQLPAYMREALSESERTGAKAHPAGMFIYNIKDPVIKAADIGKEDGEFRMNGLCVDDSSILMHIDRKLSEPDGESDVIPVKLKNGDVKESSVAVDAKTFMSLLERNGRLMKNDAEKILGGDIEARPCMYDGGTPCSYCGFGAVCGFDRKIPGFSVRNISKLSKAEVVRNLEDE